MGKMEERESMDYLKINQLYTYTPIHPSFNIEID